MYFTCIYSKRNNAYNTNVILKYSKHNKDIVCECEMYIMTGWTFSTQNVTILLLILQHDILDCISQDFKKKKIYSMIFNYLIFFNRKQFICGDNCILYLHLNLATLNLISDLLNKINLMEVPISLSPQM